MSAMLRNAIISAALFITVMALMTPLSAADAFQARLNAVKLSTTQIRQGESIRASFEFVNVGGAPANEELTVFVHVRPAAPGDPDVPPMTGADFRPATPTFAWQPGAVIEERDQPIRIPKEFSPGHYRVFIGLYNPGGGGQFKLANEELAAGRRYRIATIEVLPANKSATSQPFEMRWSQRPAGKETAQPRLATNEPVVVLGNGSLKVKISAARPVVLGYESRVPEVRSLPGDATGYPVRARIRRPAGDCRTIVLREPSLFTMRQSPDEVRFSVQVRDEGKLAASFDVLFRCQENVLHAGVERVREEPGFLLMDVSLPQLVSASGDGTLVVPTQAGRLVHLNRSAPGRHVIRMNWHEMDLCGAVTGHGLAAAVRTRNWDSELEARISGVPGNLSGGFAPRFVLRADGSAKGAWLKLAESAAVEVAIIERGEDAAHPTWVDAAKWLRRDIKGTPLALYQDTFLYKIFCDTPGAKNYTTFDEALEVIRKVHQLAPWVKQVVYLVGWQYHGHDTGYPATDQINVRLGGLEGLRRLVAEAEKLNAIVSYHDNFDDAYRESPQWDESVIARDMRGELQKGGVWAGGQSYILAFGKYANKSGLERVRRTVGQMPLRGSYHIDVLSAVPLRRDYNAEAPENSVESLAGKFAILSEFNRLGIDVTSEGFTAPFIGRIGHGWHLWRNDEPLFAGEESVPFIPMIYHGGPTTYGRGKRTATYARENALYGAAFAGDWSKHTSMQSMAEVLYLVAAPWISLRDRKMQNYERRGEISRVTYSADTFVEVDEKTGQWRVVVDGWPVVEKEVAVVRRDHLVAVYAHTAQRASVRLPAAFQNKRLRVRNASTGEDLTKGVTVSGDVIALELKASETVLVEVAGSR